MKKQNQIALTESANTLYNQIVKDIPESRHMTIGDKHLLMMYAITLDMYNESINSIAVDGHIQEFPNGTKQVSPNYTVMRNCIADLMKLSNQLSLNTQSKMKLKIPTSIELSDPLNEL